MKTSAPFAAQMEVLALISGISLPVIYSIIKYVEVSGASQIRLGLSRTQIFKKVVPNT